MALGSMKILLMAVYARAMNVIYEELGICYIASYLREKGFEVKLIAEYQGSIDYEEIINFQPDIIGMPMYTVSESAVFTVSSELKKYMPDVRICVGGYSPTFRGAEILKESVDIDYVIRGEGEKAMLRLVTRLAEGGNLKGIGGLIYREGNQIIVNEDQELEKDLNTLPWPSRDLLAQKKYNIALLSTSRGCTGSCSFCITKAFWKKWRGRDVKDVVDEMEYVFRNYDINVFYFIDCSFENPGICYERVRDIAEEIIKRNLTIYYFAFMRADFQRKATPELMELLKRSGMVGSILGIESANEQSLKIYNKAATVEDNTAAVELFSKYGIHVEIGFIMFNPYSTFEGLRRDIDFLEKYYFACNIDYFASIYAMFKGCSLNRTIEEDGLLTDAENIYGYRFVDERVMKLAYYVFNHVARVNVETNAALMKIRTNLAVLEYWRRIFAENEAMYKAIVETGQYFHAIRNEFNARVSEWFRKLMSLAEDKWDEGEAELLTTTMLSHEYILNVAKNLEHRKNVLHIKLSRLGYDLKRAPFIEGI